MSSPPTNNLTSEQFPPAAPGAPPPAPDVPPANQFSPATDLDATLKHFTENSQAWKDALAGLSTGKADVLEVIASIWKFLSWLFLEFVKGEGAVFKAYEDGLAGLMTQALQEDLPISAQLGGTLGQVMSQFITGSAAAGPGSAPYGVGAASQELLTSVIDRIGLFSGAADPQTVGSGIQNARYLLAQGVQMNLASWAIGQITHLPGLGWLKHFESFDQVIMSSFNPQNMVRMMMDAMYTQLVRLPLTRDLNHLHPIKDLGITATAKLYMRGALTASEYQDKLLDAGLDSTQAEQLLIETFKPVPVADVASLVIHQVWTESQALTYLQQIGYMDPYGQLLLDHEMNRDTYARMRSVGSQIIEQYHKGLIDVGTMTTLLEQLDFTQSEIAVIEIEHTVVALHGSRGISYGELKRLYDANLVDLDYVLNYLTNARDHRGVPLYSQDEVTLLVLLDFTASSEIEARRATLAARERVSAERARVAATAAAAKTETDLTAALNALAAQLDKDAALFGAPLQLP